MYNSNSFARSWERLSRIFQFTSHKKNHIATTMINTVLFKISTHIFTRRMTATCTNTTVSNIISTHILTKRMTSFSQVPRRPSSKFQLTSSRRGWLNYLLDHFNRNIFNSHPHEEDDAGNHTLGKAVRYFNSHPHEEDDDNLIHHFNPSFLFQLTSSRRGLTEKKKRVRKGS